MKQTLIVFYSRSGYTRRVAAELASALDADVAEIIERRSRSGLLGYLRSGYDVMKKRAAVIEPLAHSLRDYATVIVGTPVWAGHVCTPVRAFLDTYASGIARVGLFCTYGGSGADRCLGEMQGLCGVEPVATLALTDREIDAHDAAKEQAFVRSMRAART